MVMRQSTIEKRIKAGKRQPDKFITLSGGKIQFIEAPNSDYLSYLRFEDAHGNYLGALDGNWDRKHLRQLQRWVYKCLKDSE